MNEIVVSLYNEHRAASLAGQLARHRATPRIDEFPVLSVSRGPPRDRRNLQSHSNTYWGLPSSPLLEEATSLETLDGAGTRGFARHCFSRIVEHESRMEIRCALSPRETRVDFSRISSLQICKIPENLSAEFRVGKKLQERRFFLLSRE